MVDLVRSEHPDARLVAVSLRRGPDDVGVRLTVPGRVRVVETEVADRVARLLDAAVAHARGAGLPAEIDLDRLVTRAEADVTGRRRA
ncbi:hypothetical protein [Actinomycetospora lemnae]|uniref:YbaB/EbfC family DNA-binding protein n=1 Tax=Actinomycetospora lemnae TaxID=3019891 RepID=A0ABT5SRK2_9PSEU|nr:hypothetical protein [Actinomycetospora sp. DW7H6]MDD7965331.1 hypothetical protein [Actinomycetospora sp. DW7H6]